MDITVQAFKELYPEKFEGRYCFSLEYTGRFKGYNANVRYTKESFRFTLSKRWRHVGNDIKVGLIQSLLNKAFNTKKKTFNTDLYELFLKNIHLAVPKDKIDPLLKVSFDRVNERYFSGMITMPNLVFRPSSGRKLGSYDYGTDTISISRGLISDPEALDYVMYHEMLHKKLKFYTKKEKSIHHSGEFKKKEKEFENASEIEKRLRMISL